MANENLTINSLLDIFYPIGSYYETSDENFNPNMEWSGVWVEDTIGRVTISRGEWDDNLIYTVGSNGGLKDSIIPYHNHSVSSQNTYGMSDNENHSHSFEYAAYNRDSGTSTSSSLDYGGKTKYTSSTTVAHTHEVPEHVTNYVGTSENTINTNMPPYKVVIRWHRIA